MHARVARSGRRQAAEPRRNAESFYGAEPGVTIQVAGHGLATCKVVRGGTGPLE